MAEIVRSFLLVVVGLYILLRGAKIIRTRQAILDPMEKVALFILRSLGKTEEAIKKEEELLQKKNPVKSGWSSVVFGGLIILMGALGLIVESYLVASNQ